MATMTTYNKVGIREDLSDIIYNVGIKETVLLSLIPTEKATNTFHEWQKDSYSSPSTSNALVEGAISAASQSDGTRLGNYCQISDKTFQVSRTAESVNSAGKSSEIAYQKIKKGVELMRDIESILFNNQASVAGNASTARKTGGLPSWLTTNVSRGEDGENGGYSSGLTVAATNGTQRALTEDIFKAVLVTMAGTTRVIDGGIVLAGAFNKQKISGFTGSNTRFNDIKNGVINATVDVYVSDFGTLNIKYSPFQAARDVYIIKPDYLGVAYITKMQSGELSKTDDSTKYNMISEYSLVVKDESAHAVIADLTTS